MELAVAISVAEQTGSSTGTVISVRKNAQPDEREESPRVVPSPPSQIGWATVLIAAELNVAKLIVAVLTVSELVTTASLLTVSVAALFPTAVPIVAM